MFDAFNAILMLDLQRQSYNQEAPFATSIKCGATEECLTLAGGSTRDIARMRQTLIALATTGFSTTKTAELGDKVVETISKRNVGGVVSLAATVVVRRRTFQLQGFNHCLVPINQFLRLMIAKRMFQQ